MLIRPVKQFKIYPAFFLTCACLMAMVSCFNRGSGDLQNIKSAAGEKQAITWHKPFIQKDTSVIAGSVNTGSGRFEFRWIISSDGKPELITMQASGSAELPPKPVKIFSFSLPDKSTVLFQERYPLLNSRKPASLILVVRVSTADLFSVVPGQKTPPSSAAIKDASEIKWNTGFTKNKTTYFTGTAQSESGMVHISWKQQDTGLPELIKIDRMNEDKLPVKEKKLRPWMIEESGVALLFEESFLLHDEKGVSYLRLAAAVKNDDLLSGFKKTGYPGR